MLNRLTITGDTVAVFGYVPVGQFAIASALLMDAGRVVAVDRYEAGPAMAHQQGAFAVNFEREARRTPKISSHTTRRNLVSGAHQ